MTVNEDLRDTAALREDLIRRRLAGNRRRRPGITPADRTGPLPLSFGQRRLWLLHQIDPASRDWVTLDENGRIVRTEAHEARAAELGLLFEAWFEAYVKPAFPEGAPMPVIAFDELNDVVTA